jgi:ATP-dependent transcriptional regulator
MLLCFLLFPWNARTQQAVIDSLDNVINNSNTAKDEQIEAICQKANILTVQKKFAEAALLVGRAKALNRRDDIKTCGALIYSALASIYAGQDSLALAFAAMDSAQWYAGQTDDKLTKGLVVNKKAWFEMLLENTDKAYEYRLEALRMLEGVHTQQAAYTRSNIYHHLAAAEGHWGRPEKQLKFANLSLSEALNSKDADAISNAYLSMGVSFLYRYRKDTSRKILLDSSMHYTNKVLTFSQANEDHITVPSTTGIASLNLANLYHEFYPVSYQDSANAYLEKALQIGKETGNVQIIGNSYGILSEYALKEGNADRAESLLLSALSEMSSGAEKATRMKSRIVNALARVAEKQGDDAKALTYYKQYVTLDKELFDEEKFSIAQKLEAQYQSEKKEMALSSASQEAAFTRKLNRYYLVLLIAGFMALFFLFRSYRFRLKAARQRQLLLAGEKNEAQLQASLKAEETARLQAERKLMQERLDRLEKELLAGTLQTEEKNTLLKDLTEQLTALDSSDPLHQKINRLLSRNSEVDKSYQDIRAEFAEIHPDFISGLQQKAENRLTRLDLKYCSYILMGLTNKEIAVKLNVAPKSIRMARYRIKQKLKLAEEESLDDFIDNLAVKPHI